MTVQALAFAPHPDDAELYCSGTLLELKRAGYTIGIVDLTAGELSTRGDPQTRREETEAATRVMQLDVRVNLSITDGDISNTTENRMKVVEVLRACRPEVVFLPYHKDRHPDHSNTCTLVREAMFFSGLERLPSELDAAPQRPHRPARAFHYMMTTDFTPSLIVDISDSFDRKMEAIRCYASQFHVGEVANEPRTYVSSKAFMESLVARSRRFGFQIGTTHGEGFEPLQSFGVSASVLFNSHPR